LHISRRHAGLIFGIDNDSVGYHNGRAIESLGPVIEGHDPGLKVDGLAPPLDDELAADRLNRHRRAILTGYRCPGNDLGNSKPDHK